MHYMKPLALVSPSSQPIYNMRLTGVSSVLEFGLLMDETIKEIAKAKLGITMDDMDNPIGIQIKQLTNITKNI